MVIIAFEGIDGSGKSTQAKMLQDFLEVTSRKDVYYTKLPDYSQPIGQAIKWALSKEHLKTDDNTDVIPLLYAAEHNKFYKDYIRCNMQEKDGILIMDRSVISNFAYFFDKGYIYDIQENVVRPDYVFFIETSPVLARTRMEESGKHLDIHEEDIKQQEQVRKNYLEVMEIECIDNNYFVIPNNDSPMETHSIITTICKEILDI